MYGRFNEISTKAFCSDVVFQTARNEVKFRILTSYFYRWSGYLVFCQLCQPQCRHTARGLYEEIGRAIGRILWWTSTQRVCVHSVGFSSKTSLLCSRDRVAGGHSVEERMEQTMVWTISRLANAFSWDIDLLRFRLSSTISKIKMSFKSSMEKN